MSDLAVLLPSSSGPFERAAVAGIADDLPVPYATLMDPYQTRVDLLPWLAAHHSVDLWFDDWPVSRKREIIAQYAGVSTLYPGESLAELKGTHEGALRYLAFVDAEVIDRIEYPARFVIGKSAFGVTPINHPALKKRWLVKVILKKPVNAFVLGRSALGVAALRTVDRTPIERAKKALDVARAPETEYLISTAWRRPATFEDDFPEGSLPFGAYVDRTRL
ncbi:phage tail protein I [Pannonibacter sp. P2PFMT1]|uniref:phage tail protein I n=1 Tax=Pannonibacter sp. P2PFMT1 TaxID=2003582 RepID=UPI0016455374|nr:phage tail protein I [Pannonibacter sp. P2PFMT1]